MQSSNMNQADSSTNDPAFKLTRVPVAEMVWALFSIISLAVLLRCLAC